MCQPLRSGSGARRVSQSRGSSRASFRNISIATGFTSTRRRMRTRPAFARIRRQAGCMARTEKRARTETLPQQVAWAVAAAEDKKAGDIVVLDLRKAAGFTDYFIICSGQNARQIRAIADAVVDALGSHEAKPAHVEGYDRSEWVLL